MTPGGDKVICPPPYKYINCIFCNNNWHQNESPSQHLFEHCIEIHKRIGIRIEQIDNVDKKYSKWNLVCICKLANEIVKELNK